MNGRHSHRLSEESTRELAPVVAWEARSLARHAGIEVLPDLVQCGWLGAIEAAARYEPTRGARLSTFARHRIRGSMIDFLRRQPRSRVSLDDSVHAAPDESLEQRTMLRSDVRAAMQRLPRSQQRLIAEVVVLERGTWELARVRCVKHALLQKDLWDGLRELRIQLDAYAPPTRTGRVAR